ncbi:hypothetical protein H0H87_001084, partial [Tephrocybe sp. NHM501043]
MDFMHARRMTVKYALTLQETPEDNAYLPPGDWFIAAAKRYVKEKERLQRKKEGEHGREDALEELSKPQGKKKKNQVESLFESDDEDYASSSDDDDEEQRHLSKRKTVPDSVSNEGDSDNDGTTPPRLRKSRRLRNKNMRKAPFTLEDEDEDNTSDEGSSNEEDNQSSEDDDADRMAVNVYGRRGKDRLRPSKESKKGKGGAEGPASSNYPMKKKQNAIIEEAFKTPSTKKLVMSTTSPDAVTRKRKRASSDIEAGGHLTKKSYQ